MDEAGIRLRFRSDLERQSELRRVGAGTRYSGSIRAHLRRLLPRPLPAFHPR